MSFGVAPVAPHLQTCQPFSKILRLITKKFSYEKKSIIFNCKSKAWFLFDDNFGL